LYLMFLANKNHCQMINYLINNTTPVNREGLERNAQCFFIHNLKIGQIDWMILELLSDLRIFLVLPQN